MNLPYYEIVMKDGTLCDLVRILIFHILSQSLILLNYLANHYLKSQFEVSNEIMNVFAFFRLGGHVQLEF
jgi:hypothetical protein